MIVMTRGKGESIVVGGTERRIEVQVVEVRGDKVRLGIVTPPDTSVRRMEIEPGELRVFGSNRND